jgi:hypothetical protein
MILFHIDSPAQSHGLIESGNVRTFALRDADHEIAMDIYGRAEFFGETAILDGNARSTGAMTLQKTVPTRCGGMTSSAAWSAIRGWPVARWCYRPTAWSSPPPMPRT